MKLHNQSLKYISVSFFVVITAWALVFYFNMLHEIKESIDEGLENYKRLIIMNVDKDTTLLSKNYFDESFFSIHPIAQAEAEAQKDRYVDSIMLMQDADDDAPEREPVRMLISAFEYKGKYYRLNIVNSMVEEDDLVEELLYDTLWLYLVLLAGTFFVNSFLLKRLWKPFYAMLGDIKVFKLGKTERLPVIHTNTTEFKDLEHAVNVLLRQSIAAFEQQKQFIGNAAHELQTPVAIATQQLELLLESESLPAPQVEKIAQVLATIERLGRLNKSLLLLAKIENRQFFANSLVSLNDIVSESISDYEEFASFRQVEISFVSHSPFRFFIDPVLARIIVDNLLKNAIIHNRPGGKVEIVAEESRLTVANSAIAGALDSKGIFTRFYKSDASTSGSGLGLAILKAITDLYSLHIAYEYSSGMHRFYLELNSGR